MIKPALHDLVENVVPLGKNLTWLITAAATAFLGGVGFTLTVGDRAQHIDTIPMLTADVESHALRITLLEEEVEQTEASLERIRCLAALSATGQTVDPLQIDDVCP